MAKCFFSLPIEAKMEVVAQSFVTSFTHIQSMQIEKPETPPFKGYSPMLSENNSLKGDLHEGFELGWESPIKDVSSGVQVKAGANVWPSEEHVPRFRQTVLDYQ